MNILVLLTVVCCTAVAVPLLSEDGGQKETLAMVNGSSPAIAKPRDKRGVGALVTVGTMIASGFISAITGDVYNAWKSLFNTHVGGGGDRYGVADIEIDFYHLRNILHQLSGYGDRYGVADIETDFDDLRNILDQLANELNQKLNRLLKELKDISNELEYFRFLIMTQQTKNQLDCLERIRYYGYLLRSELHGSDEMLWDDILDFNTGIHWHLHKLNSLIIGETTFGDGFGDAYDPFLVKLFKMYTHGRDMNRFMPNEHLGNLMKNAITKLLEYQISGYQVKSTATLLNMASTNKTNKIESKLTGIENAYESQLRLQTNTLSALMKDCPPIRELQIFYVSFLNCTDGFKFGSICRQKCANWFTAYFRPPYHDWGPEEYALPVQCLLDGKWSNNFKGKSIFPFCIPIPQVGLLFPKFDINRAYWWLNY